MDAELVALQEKGLIIMGQPNAGLQKRGPGDSLRLRIAMDGALAFDAQPQLITQSNSGIPAFLSTFIDPKLIDVIFAPMKAAEVVGNEIKKGDWTTETAMFPVTEFTGEVSSYGDYSENGMAGFNVNWANRQSYTYQTFTQWGERELEKAGLGRIDWANGLNRSSVFSLNKYQNLTYFFGVAGLLNFGLLNDPNLLASITPTPKAAGGTQWFVNGKQNATALEVIADISAIYYQLQTQADGNVDLDTKMTLAMSPLSEVALTFTTEFNVNVADILKKNYPNMTVKTAPEYNTASGEFVQLIADEIQGQRTVDVAFTEKLRAHPIIIQASSFKQKKSQGTWGAIIYRPVFISSMIGV